MTAAERRAERIRRAVERDAIVEAAKKAREAVERPVWVDPMEELARKVGL